MPLHVDYRPTTLDKVVGNLQTVRALESFLRRSETKRAHSLLFTGQSGCGKTTLARIVAAGLGAFDGNPNECPDYTELNASDFRGVDMVRSIRKQMHLCPVKGSCRVWLLDEVHKLTGDAQEALLKCLEEPPSHVYFILATTEPEKLKVTLKRRCTPFEVGPVDEMVLLKLMKRVIRSEADSVQEEQRPKVSKRVIRQIARDAMGSPGVALMILDKIIGMSMKDQMATARQAAAQQNAAIELCRELMGQRPVWSSVSRTLNGLKQEDPEKLRRAVVGYASSVLLSGKTYPRAYVVLDSFMTPTYDNGFPGLVHACYTAMPQ